jgi:hypothetical protein
MPSEVVESLLEKYHALPPAEQREFLEALFRKPSPLVPGSHSREKVRYTGKVIDVSRERQWVDEHRAEYAGLWVSVRGDRLLSSGTDAKKVYEEARAAGDESPYLVRVEPPDALPWGGW